MFEIPSQHRSENQSAVMFTDCSSNSILSQKMFEKWQAFIYRNTGIFFRDNRKYLLESRLIKRLKHLSLNSFDEYFSIISDCSEYQAEKQYFYDAITINETFFFRNQPQLDALVLKILPELIAELSKTEMRTIRIWSAATSSGEEAYSIAMMISEFIKPKYPGINIEIIGTDISTEVIAKAKKGVFSEYSMKHTPIYFIKKYFKSQDNLFELNPEIKEAVKFELGNLYEDHHYKKKNYYDIIFCANVLIYFDDSSKLKVINNLYKSLVKGGHLFIGYSETLHGLTNSFKLISFPKTIGYQKEKMF